MRDELKETETVVEFQTTSEEFGKEECQISLLDNPLADDIRLITFFRPIRGIDLTTKGNLRQWPVRSLSEDKKQLETTLLVKQFALRGLYILLQKEFEQEMIVRLPRIVIKNIPQLNGEIRKEYDHDWVWENGTVNVIRSHWKSSKGNLVRVYPPSDEIDHWFVTVCDMDGHKFTGEDAETRAFAVAEGYTRQKGH